MGQARARGTFEERRAKAIEEGRIKRPLCRWHYEERLSANDTVFRTPVQTTEGRISSPHLLMARLMERGPVQPNV